MEEFLQEAVFRGRKWESIYECIDSFLKEHRISEEALFSKVFARAIEEKHGLNSTKADRIEEIFLEELKKGRDVRDLFLRSLEDPEYIFKKPEIPEDIVNLLTSEMDENKLKELILANKLFRKSGLRKEVIEKARKQNNLTRLVTSYPYAEWKWDYIAANPNADYDFLLSRIKKIEFVELINVLGNPNLSLVEMKKLIIAKYPEGPSRPSDEDPDILIVGKEDTKLVDDNKPLTFTDLKIISAEQDGDYDIITDTDFLENPRLLINFKEVIAKHHFWFLLLLETKHFTMDDFPFTIRGKTYNSPNDFGHVALQYFSSNPNITFDVIKKYKVKWNYTSLARHSILEQKTIDLLRRKKQTAYLGENKTLTTELVENNRDIFIKESRYIYKNPNIDWRTIKSLIKQRELGDSKKYYVGSKTFKIKNIKKLKEPSDAVAYALSSNENLTFEYIRNNKYSWDASMLSMNNFGRRIKTKETMMVE